MTAPVTAPALPAPETMNVATTGVPATTGISTPLPNRERDVVIKVGTSLEEAERVLIMATLNAVSGSKARAAEVLGISLKTLYNRLHAYRTPETAATSNAVGSSSDSVPIAA